MTVLLTLLGVSAYSQQVTPSGTGDKVDTLAAAVFVGRNQGNYLSKGKDLRTEVISSAGLMKMACCNLAHCLEEAIDWWRSRLKQDIIPQNLRFRLMYLLIE